MIYFWMCFVLTIRFFLTVAALMSAFHRKFNFFLDQTDEMYIFTDE